MPARGSLAFPPQPAFLRASPACVGVVTRGLPPPSTSFCAEHARRNTLALQAQMKKPNPGPVSETLLCQLSSYARSELGPQSAESSRSEASRILGENPE